MKTKLTLENTAAIKCICGNETFYEGMRVRTVSALLTDDGKEGIIPIPALVCTKCGEAVEKSPIVQ